MEPDRPVHIGPEFRWPEHDDVAFAPVKHKLPFSNMLDGYRRFEHPELIAESSENI
ncbi:hypothetical protein D3C81_2197040 [compost metagenome]